MHSSYQCGYNFIDLSYIRSYFIDTDRPPDKSALDFFYFPSKTYAVCTQ